MIQDNIDQPAAAPAPRPAAPALSVTQGFALRINCPAWFQRQDFQDWRRGLRQAQGQRPEASPATWQSASPDYQDVFLTCEPGLEGDEWEGSDTQGLPEDIFLAIGAALGEQRLRWPQWGILWLSGVGLNS